MLKKELDKEIERHHKEKFKGIITVSKWQRDNIIKELNIKLII